MKPASYFLIVILANLVIFCHPLEFFACDDSKGNDSQYPICIISGVTVTRKESLNRKFAFSSQDLPLSVRFIKSNLAYLQRELFREMAIKKLFIEGVNLQELPPYTFKYASELKELHAADNQIKKISSGSFKGAEGLVTLDLARNEINFIHSSAFSGLKSLKYVDLSNNNLRILDSTWFVASQSLTLINMKNNKFDSIELDLSDKLSLTDLDLSAQQGIGSPMQNLTLHLNCSNLRNLDVSFNTALEEITVICNDKNERNFNEVNLYLMDTSLGYGGKTGLNLDPLLEIHDMSLDKNLYFNVDELRPLAGNLKELSLAGNVYKKFPETITNLTELESLSLSGIGPQIVEPSMIRQFKSLKSLDLSFNQLTSIDLNEFERMGSLEDLYLNDNLLTALDYDVLSQGFQIFPSLQFIDLRNNRFSSTLKIELVEMFEERGISIDI